MNKKGVIGLSLSTRFLSKLANWFEKYTSYLIGFVLSIISVVMFYIYYNNGLGVAYNDARSHLDIGRRVVEGLNPGVAQLGSVWLPLPHFLMIPTIWNDFMWHTGLSGAIQSMISFVATALLIFFILKVFRVSLLGRLFGVLLFVLNVNILYLQSTAMTELLLLATMTAGVYYLLIWFRDDKIIDILKSAFFIMLATLIRYDGWFLLAFATGLVFIQSIRKNIKELDGPLFFFCSLAGLGVVLWLLWNLLIFNDPLYFAFGPFSAHAQQLQLEGAGQLPTKGNLLLSVRSYFYALFYNSYTIPTFVSFVGAVLLWADKKISSDIRIASTALLSPLLFNIIALYFGHSVLMVQGISGDTWFNVRYGVMYLPSIAIFCAYLFDRVKSTRFVFAGGFALILLFALVNKDAVTIDDARYGSSQKNVSEVSVWLQENAKNEKGFILISAASHDAIIFSSKIPMKKYIHEGTGIYWESAIENPEKWARWIIMRTYDENDMTYREVSDASGFQKYNLVGQYPFADIYELKEEYIPDLITDPIYQK